MYNKLLINNCQDPLPYWEGWGVSALIYYLIILVLGDRKLKMFFYIYLTKNYKLWEDG